VGLYEINRRSQQRSHTYGVTYEVTPRIIDTINTLKIYTLLFFPISIIFKMNTNKQLCTICNKMKSIKHKPSSCIQNKSIKSLSQSELIFCYLCNTHHINSECKFRQYHAFNELPKSHILDYNHIISNLTPNQVSYYINHRFIQTPKIYNNKYLYFPQKLTPINIEVPTMFHTTFQLINNLLLTHTLETVQPMIDLLNKEITSQINRYTNLPHIIHNS